MNNETPTPRTDKVVSDDMGDSRFIIDLITHAQQLERELNEAKNTSRAMVRLHDEQEKEIEQLSQERDQLREWVAREIQQMTDMSGGVPFAWEKLDEHNKANWRMRADEAADRLASQGAERNTK